MFFLSCPPPAPLPQATVQSLEEANRRLQASLGARTAEVGRQESEKRAQEQTIRDLEAQVRPAVGEGAGEGKTAGARKRAR